VVQRGQRYPGDLDSFGDPEEGVGRGRPSRRLEGEGSRCIFAPGLKSEPGEKDNESAAFLGNHRSRKNLLRGSSHGVNRRNQTKKPSERTGP